MANSPYSHDLALYNGVSKRSRGWKSRTRLDEFMDGRLPRHSNVKRWDGAARMCYDWDNLRRDPELWFRNGNCFVHLYGKGQSRRGPAFKVPFSDLLDAKCHPLVQKFVVQYIAESPGPADGEAHDMDPWGRANRLRAGRIDLYIPAPPGSDKDEALLYHLTVRNFFAWIFSRSMVGDHLGGALASLMHSMREFRSLDADHVSDLLDYLDEEGYLDMRGQPNHALAILHLAEMFKLRDLYIDAFAHCTGMSDRLFLSSEYQNISSASRKLIRRARVDMDVRLGSAGTRLRTFLEDDLSEAHLGLSGAARAHLDRFRSFLLSFYTTKLGYYPPSSIDARITIFQPQIYRTLAADFEALYDYIVDESFTLGESSPILAQGGICTLQSVESFDLRHKYKTLVHPLPLLPEMTTTAASRRMSWLGKPDKLRPDNRLVAHAALMKATNKSRIDLFSNSLVCAYRKFEEDSIFAPLKSDRMEKISHVDARKVRWILVYGVYQTLRNCTLAPAEVRDTRDVPYNLAVSTENLPPWKEEPATAPLVLRGQTANLVLRTTSVSSAGDSATSSEPVTPSFEIKPDIDYFALTHRQDAQRPSTARSSRTISNGPPIIPPRSISLTRSLTRSGTFRRSLSIFKGSSIGSIGSGGSGSHTPEPVVSVRPRQQSSYYEIVVHGYGNGTNAVNLSFEGDDIDKLLPPPALMTNRSPSTSSNSSAGAASSAASSSSGGGETTRSDSSSSLLSSPPTPESPASDYTPSAVDDNKDKDSMITTATSSTSTTGRRMPSRGRQPVRYTYNNTLPHPPPRPRSAASAGSSSVYSADDSVLPSASAPAIPARSTARNRLSLGADPQQHQLTAMVMAGSGAPGERRLQPSPLRVRKRRVTVAEILDCVRAGGEGGAAWHEIPATMVEESEVNVDGDGGGAGKEEPNDDYYDNNDDDDDDDDDLVFRLTTATATATTDDIKPEWEQYADLGGHTILPMATTAATAIEA